uniref:Ig-like domain-containing protein n=1 Tax=Amphilophus citrinellus TaxID=61819 RepID=A0A3Q0RIR8_AMPCI
MKRYLVFFTSPVSGHNVMLERRSYPSMFSYLSESRSLTYMYTALSKPVGLPGIHQFTAMGLLDDRIIDYYDSENQMKVPRQEWMREGTQSRKSKEQWFKVNIAILMERMRQENTTCKFFLCFNMLMNLDLHSISTSPQDVFSSVYFTVFPSAPHRVYRATLDSKCVWNNRVLTEYTKGYLENECIDWLSKFVTYEEQHPRDTSPPEVYLSAENSTEDTNVRLTCLATGFYPTDIVLRIKKNESVLTVEDGLMSSGVRPNEDDTFQRRDQVEVLRSDLSAYSCEVIHEAANVSINRVWGKKPLSFLYFCLSFFFLSYNGEQQIPASSVF